jgi:hypothetical protein
MAPESDARKKLVETGGKVNGGDRILQERVLLVPPLEGL